MISHACRLSYQLYILSNRIVKPNNRYTRQPALHDFLFYSVPDKVYVLTATNRIAMRFAVHSAPAFRYRTKRTDNSKGGIVSGTAVRRFAILRIAQTIPKAELSAATRRPTFYKLLLRVTPPFRYLLLYCNSIKGGTWSGSQPQPHCALWKTLSVNYIRQYKPHSRLSPLQNITHQSASSPSFSDLFP